MATIVTREFGATAKGSPLTNQELDNNFINLNAELAAKEQYKAPVKAATTASIVLSGEQTIDGVLVSSGDRVLVKNQASAADNGIYTVSNTLWSRAEDSNTTKLAAHCIARVDLGTVHAGDMFTSTLKSTDTLGTTPFTFAKIPTVPIKYNVQDISQLLVTPEQGTIEVGTDGALYYTDNTVVGRGALNTSRGIYLAANAANIGTAATNFFGPTNAGVQLEGSSVYEIVCFAYFSKSTASTVTFQWVTSSAPTLIRSRYDATAVAGFTTATVTTAAVNTSQAVANSTATLAHAASGSLATGANHVFEFRVIVSTNLGTSLKLQAAAASGSLTPLAGSFMYVRKMHINTGVLTN